MHLENRWLVSLDVELHDAGLLRDHLWGGGRRGEHLHAGLLRDHLQSDTLRRTQTHSDASDPTHSNALRRTPTQSGAIRRNQTHSDGLTWSSVSLRAVTVYVVERIDGSTLRPPTCGEGRGAVVSTCMQGCSVDGCT